MSDLNISATTFLSANSGNDSGHTFVSASDSSHSLLLKDLDEDAEESFRILSENLEMQLNGDEVDTCEEEEENSEDDDIISQEREFDDMFSRSIEYIENCSSVTMERTDILKSQTSLVDQETKDVILERDQALQDLRGVEQAFSDVHRKYERAKLVLENLKINEDHLKQRDEEFQLLISARDQKYQALKQEMEQNIEKMYNDFQTKLAAVENDNGKLTVLYRRVEMRAETLESELVHKQKENAQLNVLADDLIGKSANVL